MMRKRSRMAVWFKRRKGGGLGIRSPEKSGDRRYTRVALTEQGQRLRSQVIASHDYLINRRLERLPEESLRELRTLLQELSDELQSQLENGKTPGLIEDAAQ